MIYAAYLRCLQGGTHLVHMDEKGPAGVHYSRSKSGWFDDGTFHNYFTTILKTHAKNIPGKKVLLGDNLSTHFTPKVLIAAAENDVVMACLVPNATHDLMWHSLLP